MYHAREMGLKAGRKTTDSRRRADLFRRAVVLTRVGLDQFVLTPVMVSVFFSSMSLMEGKGIEGAKEKLSQAYWPTLQKNWGVFSASESDSQLSITSADRSTSPVPVQLLNFALVPAHLRIGECFCSPAA